MTPLNLASWLLTGRFTAAAPGTTEFLGDALSAIEKGEAAREPSTLALFFGILWKLALVVALIVVTIWLIKRLMRGGMLPMSSEGGIKILSVTHLSARHSIYLIEVGQRLLVVGAGADSLSLLTELASPAEKEAVKEALAGRESRFSSYLASWAAKMTGGEPRQQLRDGSDFLKESLDRMRRGSRKTEDEKE